MPDVAIAADRLTKTYLRATSSPVIGRTLRDDIGRLAPEVLMNLRLGRIVGVARV